MSDQPRRRGYYNLERLIGRGANAILRKFGYEVVRAREAVSQHAALERLRPRHIPIKTVIDVGASDGRWTREVRPFFPDARFLLIEANDVHRAALEQFSQENTDVEFVMGVAGSSVGEVSFDGSDPLGGTATLAAGAGDGFETRPSVTIDQEVNQRRLKPPYFIKLDTHGFELPILAGAGQILAGTNLLLIETYNFPLTAESVLFYEMCAFMAEHDFRPVDLCAPLFRPGDGALWQVDFFFIRKGLIQGDRYLDG